MAEEAEISFEEAMGAAPSTTPPSLKDGEISFAEAMSGDEVSANGPSFLSSARERISQASAVRTQLSDIRRTGREQMFDSIINVDLKDDPTEGFAESTGKTALRGIRALVTAPGRSLAGGVKALAGGVVSLAESAVSGVRGLGRAAGETLVRETVGRIPLGGRATSQIRGMVGTAAAADPLSSAVEEIESSMQQTTAMRDIAAQITKINIAPANEQEAAMEGLLMILPEGVVAAGDTVYEKTGSALAGAGAQALLTLLTMTPETAGKVVSSSIKSVKSKQLFTTTFDALAITEPESAKSIIEHIKKTDPQTAQKMRMRYDAAEAKWKPSELGEEAVKAEIKAKTEPEIKAEEVGVAKAEVKPKAKAKTKAKPQPQPQPKAKPKEILPEEVGVGLSKAMTELAEVKPPVPVETATAPKLELAKPTVKEAPQLIVDEFTGQFEVKSTAGELLAQESGRYLQVKRADVVAAKRGEGHAQAMMEVLIEEAGRRNLTVASDFSVSPDAVRVYERLRDKRGYTVITNPHTTNPATGNKVSRNPRVPVFEIRAKLYESGNKPKVVEVAKEPTAPPETIPAAVAEQIFVSGPTLDALPGGQFVQGKLTAWYNQIIRNVNPEALGKKAQMAAAVLAKKIAETSNREAANYGLAGERIKFWSKLTPSQLSQFIKFFETGAKFKDPVFQKAADNIRTRMKDIFAADQKLGIKYDPVDNYLYHIFEDSEAVTTHFETKYGRKWGDPAFTKDRAFDFYEEAVKAGFKPKFTNPEEIVLARQHASDVAAMRVELLTELEGYGLAKKAVKDKAPLKGNWSFRRSPNGDGFWVDKIADQILHNAFDTKSLWNTGGMVGDAFKGAMFLKNSIVPAILAISLFHPLHLLLGMDSAATMVRLTKQMVTGNLNPVVWFGKWLESLTLGSKGIPLKGIVDNPKLGFRLLNAISGKLDPAKLTKGDLIALTYINEGGFTPMLSEQFKTNAAKSFSLAVRQALHEMPLNRTKGIEGAAKAAWYAPYAILDKLQKPMFEHWIPAMKIASYLKDIETAVKTDPGLINDKGRRILAFRKLAKSVDNRYGEMAYNTLFWNRMIKDITVANMISLGWTLGFFREYGGALTDMGRAVTSKGGVVQKIAKGQLDRPLFVMFYTLQTMLYAGLLTWATTGQPPTELIDYLYPKSGNKNPQGQDQRLTTPFYPREIAAIAKHIEHEGVAPGMWHFISNKASGAVGMVNQWATGTDWRGQEIRDPNSPWHQKTWDTLRTSLQDLEPISIQSIREGSGGSAKDVALSISGFSKAPKYATQTDTQASISTLYQKYYAPKQTPYEKALLSNDRRKLAQFFDEGKVAEYSNLLDEMQTKYDLTAAEQGRLARNIMKRGVDYNPFVSMFERLTWQQQKRLLDEMDEDERAEYLPHANREHLRFSYEEPE